MNNPIAQGSQRFGMNQPVARFARITEFARGGLGIYDIQRVAPAGLEAEAETQAGGGEQVLQRRQIVLQRVGVARIAAEPLVAAVALPVAAVALRVATLVAAIIVIGNCSFPIAVQLGIVSN